MRLPTLLATSCFLLTGCGAVIGEDVDDWPEPHKGPDTTRINELGTTCNASANANDPDVLYTNDFEDGAAAGSMYPAHAGTGSACEDATVEAAFPWQYGPRVVKFADGKSGVRFPTSRETPGGFSYSMQSPYVTFRGRFLAEQCLAIAFDVRMPARYDVSAPQSYGDLRYLFRYYIEGANGRELFSARFVSNEEIGFYENDQRLVASLKLQEKPEGAVRHEVKIAGCFVPNGELDVSFDGAHGDPVVLGPTFERGNVFFITSPGNGVLSDDDLDLFSALDAVDVRRLSPSPSIVR